MTDVLIVDDDAFARAGLRLYLDSLGYQVREAEDVQTAWELALTKPPALAVIDIILPLQANGRSPSPPTKPHGLNFTLRLKKSIISYDGHCAAFGPSGI